MYDEQNQHKDNVRTNLPTLAGLAPTNKDHFTTFLGENRLEVSLPYTLQHLMTFTVMTYMRRVQRMRD